MRLALILLVFGSCLHAFADDFDRFARNDEIIGRETFEKAHSQIISNVQILARAIRFAKPSEIEGILARYGRLAKKNDDGYATSFGWVAGSKAVDGGRMVICVSYGPIGFVQILRGTLEIKVPESLKYVDQRSPRILYFRGRSLVIASQFVRDAGARDNTRLDFLQLDPMSSSAKLAKSIDIEHTLDWGGASVSRDAIVADSIDSPRAFFLANSEPSLKRRRTFSTNGALKTDVPGDNGLRAIDEWLLEARKTAHPTQDQALGRKLFPESELISVEKLNATAFVLMGENGKLRFSLRPGIRGFVVAAVREVR